mgnify:CR=1 FL=1
MIGKTIGKLLILLLFSVVFNACEENSVAPLPDNLNAEIITPTIINTFPHDPAAFTQGLLWHDGLFYESTGRYGQSSLREVEIESGRVLALQPVSSEFFAEGLALKNDHLVQLTWRKKTAFSYNLTDFSLADTFAYETEGWGLTSDETHFIMSDGSDQLYFRDDNFQLLQTIHVTLDGQPLDELNELEYANGKIYANVWKTAMIVEIDPQYGRVTRVIDCSELAAQENPQTSAAVLNGIAYNPQQQTFYLTGKLWNTMFEVRFE